MEWKLSTFSINLRLVNSGFEPSDMYDSSLEKQAGAAVSTALGSQGQGRAPLCAMGLSAVFSRLRGAGVWLLCKCFSLSAGFIKA